MPVAGWLRSSRSKAVYTVSGTTGVEQAILAQACPARHHTAVFARYSMAALLAGAVGALGAAALGLLSLGEPGDTAVAMYAVLSRDHGVVLALDAGSRTGRRPDSPAGTEPSRGEARRPSPLVCTLAGLFAIDAFAGGLAVQAVLALWFQQRFGVADTQLVSCLGPVGLQGSRRIAPGSDQGRAPQCQSKRRAGIGPPDAVRTVVATKGCRYSHSLRLKTM